MNIHARGLPSSHFPQNDTSLMPRGTRLELRISMGSGTYNPVLASTCAPLEFILAPALAPPTLAFIPTPHCGLQHFSEEHLPDIQQVEQHPDTTNTMASTITTSVRFTFMAHPSFFYCVLPKTILGSTAVDYSFLFSRAIG